MGSSLLLLKQLCRRLGGATALMASWPGPAWGTPASQVGTEGTQQLSAVSVLGGARGGLSPDSGEERFSL